MLSPQRNRRFQLVICFPFCLLLFFSKLVPALVEMYGGSYHRSGQLSQCASLCTFPEVLACYYAALFSVIGNGGGDEWSAKQTG